MSSKLVRRIGATAWSISTHDQDKRFNISDKEDDISVDGNCIDGSNCNGDDKSVDPDAYSKRTSSGTSLSPGLSSTFRGRAMVYYMLPTFMIWLGRNVIGTRAQATYSTSSSHGIS